MTTGLAIVACSSSTSRFRVFEAWRGERLFCLQTREPRADARRYGSADP